MTNDAPAPMALDDVRLADSGQSGAPEPADLTTVELISGAPQPEPVNLIGALEEPPPAPNGQGGADAEVRAGAAADDQAPQPDPGQGTPPDTEAFEAAPPAPMSLERLHELEQR